MTILTALLCLNGICEEHRHPAPVGIVGCLVTAEAELARAYPGWRIERWRCETEERL